MSAITFWFRLSKNKLVNKSSTDLTIMSVVNRTYTCILLQRLFYTVSNCLQNCIIIDHQMKCLKLHDLIAPLIGTQRFIMESNGSTSWHVHVIKLNRIL